MPNHPDKQRAAYQNALLRALKPLDDEARLSFIEVELASVTMPLKQERDQIRNRIRVRRHRAKS